MSAKKRLLLIDGHALLYRAYHAIPALTSPSGEPTNATFGFANMLLKAIQDYQPDYVVATFDAGETFRHQEYAAYKANRAHMPDDLRPQVERVRQLLHALAIPTYELEGYEADDLLGSLAAQATKQGLETIIVTGDSDTFQLISPEVRVLTPKRSLGEVQLYDEQAVRERYGLEPQQLVDFKALMGDPSDNIPGVAGIGEKTAAALLQQFGSLEGIYAHLDEVKPARVRQALEQHRDAALLSKRLVTIVRDLAVPLDLAASVWGRYDRAQVMELLRELGFRALVERIPQPSAQPTAGQLALFGQEGAPSTVAAQPVAPEPACTYCAVDTAPALEQLVAKLQRAERFALDTETTGVDPMRAKLVGISVAMQPKEAYYLPVGHDRRLNVGQQLPLELVRERLGPLLADGRIGKVCHNAKFDMAILTLHGMPLEGLQCDTLIAAWLLEPEGRSLSLKGQAWQRLGVEMTPIEEVIGKGNKQVHMDQVPIAQVVPYACADADMTLRLQGVLEPELKARDQWRLFAELEMPLVPILLAMELHGMVLDTDYLEAMSRQLGQRLEELRAQIYEQAGHPFNINSPQQLGTVLFEELKLPRGRRTQTGYSTDASVMESLQGKHPIVGLILEHRQLEKLKNTYVDALPALINPRTGRVHTSFNQTGTSTGRLSSSEPNLQNIPVRTELGRLVRGAFVAPPGHWLLSCDYSQVELRLLAHLSEDPELLGAFQRGEDVHASTAAAIFGVPLAAVTKEQRGLAKAINFGLMYGMSDYGLSSRTDLSVSEARQFIENYFQRFKRVKEYLEETVRLAYEKGYVETILGRRRYFPELRAGQAVNQNVRRAAERAAVNMPIQGSAADIIKLAMIQLDRRLREQGLRACMVLQVHDELVLEVPEEELETARNLVVETMENAYPLRVALKVEAAIGKNWMEMK
jgi:DNA polymerase-1